MIRSLIAQSASHSYGARCGQPGTLLLTSPLSSQTWRNSWLLCWESARLLVTQDSCVSDPASTTHGYTNSSGESYEERAAPVEVPFPSQPELIELTMPHQCYPVKELMELEWAPPRVERFLLREVKRWTHTACFPPVWQIPCRAFCWVSFAHSHCILWFKVGLKVAILPTLAPLRSLCSPATTSSIFFIYL